MEKPKVSIIVPIYNVEKYLDRCMQSLLNQTLKEIEIILVDDESPDNCPAMCDEYARLDSRIKVIHKKNEGLGLARNSGLEIVTGEYVAFVDSDDYVSLDMYNELYKLANQYNSDIVSCGHSYELKNKKVYQNDVSSLKVFSGDDLTKVCLDLIASDIVIAKERLYSISVWHAIYSNRIISDNKIRFLSERVVVSEDIPFQVDMLMHARKIVYIPDYFYNYCWNGSSLTKTFVFEKYSRLKTLRELLLHKTRSIDNSTTRVNRAFIANVHYFLQHIVEANDSMSLKLKNFKRICNDPIWVDLFNQYPHSHMPLFKKIEFYLLSKNMPLPLSIYMLLFCVVKKITH